MRDKPRTRPCVGCHCVAVRMWCCVRRLLPLLLFVLLVSPAWAKFPYPYSTCCEVYCGSSGGSATLVGVSSGRGLLLSAAHVFDGRRTAECRFAASDRRVRCRLLAVDDRLDLAALESESVEGTATAYRVRGVRTSDGTLCAVGFPFYARGGPHYTTGRFLRMRDEDLLAAFKPVVHSGFSGGGVFAPDGSLVGVVSGYNDSRESIACSGPALERFVARWLRQEGD